MSRLPVAIQLARRNGTEEGGRAQGVKSRQMGQAPGASIILGRYTRQASYQKQGRQSRKEARHFGQGEASSRAGSTEERFGATGRSGGEWRSI